jgi:pimeloyl-ACP methyl ester carboxylesterase
MQKVRSHDGTAIAFDRAGDGQPVILVDGALCHRTFGPSAPLAALLAKDFTVFTYDRRGRGDSGNSAEYSAEREIEDIDALVAQAGGSAFLYGHSSGAALALEAANHGVPVKRLALYEAPFVVDGTKPPMPNDYLPRLEASVAANRPGDAVKMFMKLVGVPAPFVFMMRLMPSWSKLVAVAPTLPYDIGLVAEYHKGKPLPAGRWTGVKVPTLVADGGKSPAWMRNGMKALASVLPNATYRTVEGQTHMLSAKAIAPVLTDFFNGGGA